MKFRFLSIYKRYMSYGFLNSLDDLYKNLISKLPVEYRVGYCTSFIYRTKEDIEKCSCKLERRRLKKQLVAAISELEN